MEFLKVLNTKTILIIPSKLKEKVLKFIDENNIFIPFKIIEFESLKRKLYFDYDDNSIYFLKNKYNIKKDVAKNYIKNLYYIDNSNSENMLFLKEIKDILEKEKLIQKDNYFLNSLKQYKVIFFGIDSYTKFDLKMIEEIKKHTAVSFIENKLYPITEAFLFENKYEQMKYVFEQISKLLKENIPLSKIKLANLKEDDYKYLKRIGKAYKIPVFIKENTLYSTEVYRNAKDKILENKLDEIEESKYINTLISKLNGLLDIQFLSDMCDEYAKEIYIDERLENCLEIVDINNNYFDDDEYVFILNCNASILPKTYKDEDYLYDKIKPIFLENTYEKTSLEEVKIKNTLNKIKNKYIYLIKREGNTEYFKSPLLENVEIKEIDLKYSISSNIQNKKDYASYLDNYRKFGTYNSKIAVLESNYKIPYQEYDNKFNKFNNFNLDSLLLSYSSLNTYYECRFKYYLNYILKLKDFEETYATYLGSLFHYVLEKADDDIDNVIKKYREDHPIELSLKEEFFLKESIKDLKETILFNQDFKNHTSLKNEEHEKKLYVSIPDKIKTTLMGVIDKKLENENKIAVIDYKTGSTKFNLKDTYHGLSMQLPIYYYLLRKNYPDMEIVGFYLQNILEKNFKSIKNKTKEEQKQSSLKLNGYSTSNMDILEKLDPTYKDSRFIQGLKVSKNGFYSYSKVLNDKQLDSLFELTDTKIKEMISEINNTNFDINPKKLRNENISCRFCPYKSICFMTEKDIVELEEKKTLEFLGGDPNA